MEPLDQIRKEIHTAFSSVSQLCEQFFRKYPQYSPVTANITSPRQPYFLGSYLPSAPEFQTGRNDSWPRYNNPQTAKENLKDTKILKQKTARKQISQQLSKKQSKEEKKYEKNLERLRIQRRKEQQRLKKMKETLKKNKRQRNTIKNRIKRDPRYAQKPKFPMSPYFLFLQQMRAKNSKESIKSLIPNKQFAEKMGEKWRQMLPQIKEPYVKAYVKEKKIFDQKLWQYYQKYPDLKPEGRRYDKPVYAVDDPKYNQENNGEEEELETDLIDELPSEEENSKEEKGNGENQTEKNQDYQENEEYEDEEEWNQQKDSLGEERATADIAAHSFREVVEID